MHICWLACHLVELNTPGWWAVRGAKDSRSGSSRPPEYARNTSPTSAWLRSPSPRTRTEPWLSTSVAQRIPVGGGPVGGPAAGLHRQQRRLAGV